MQFAESSSTAFGLSREVRLERWGARAFHVVPCSFLVDVPLDMSGCIVAALRDAQTVGHRRLPGGAILASDARRGGAVFVEVEPPESDELPVAWMEGDLLCRSLPAGTPQLRAEVTELLRWSDELARDVAAFYVGFTAGDRPRSFRPSRLYAMLDGGEIVEHFEVRTRRMYVTR